MIIFTKQPPHASGDTGRKHDGGFLFVKRFSGFDLKVKPAASHRPLHVHKVFNKHAAETRCRRQTQCARGKHMEIDLLYILDYIKELQPHILVTASFSLSVFLWRIKPQKSNLNNILNSWSKKNVS